MISCPVFREAIFVTDILLDAGIMQSTDYAGRSENRMRWSFHMSITLGHPSFKPFWRQIQFIVTLNCKRAGTVSRF